MKTTLTILALTAAGLLGQSAIADDSNANGPLGFTLISDGHGSYHYLYYSNNAPLDTSVALTTNSGNLGAPMALKAQVGVLPDQGQTKFVTGNNQHAQPMSAYIPVSSNFAQASQ